MSVGDAQGDAVAEPVGAEVHDDGKDDGDYHAAFAAKSSALDAAENDLAAAEKEWLTLEMRREEAENG